MSFNTTVTPGGCQTILSDGTVIWREAGSNVTGEISILDLHSYWRDPSNYSEKNNFNYEKDYLKCSERSIKLVELFNKYASNDDKILELGCNVGRNLHYLYSGGYHNLMGIDINRKAIELGLQHYTELSKDNFICGEIGRELNTIKPDSYDIIFTMAVLEHIHPKEQHIFFNMVRIASKFIITIEDEDAVYWRAFSYRYKDLFEYLNCKELESFQLLCKNDIDNSGDCTLTYRVFKKDKK